MWQEIIFFIFFINLCFETVTSCFLVAPACSPLFFSSDKGKGEGGGWESGDQALSSRESEWWIALVAMNELLRRISHCDRVPPSRMTVRILASTGLGDLIFELLDFRRASFDVKAVNLFPDGVYEEEGKEARRIDVLTNYSPFWSSGLSHRTPRKGCDTIIFLHVLPESVWCHSCCASWGLLRRPHFAALVGREGGGNSIACSWVLAWMKMDDYFR